MKILIVGDSFAYGHGCDDRIYYYDEKTKQWIGDKTHFFTVWDQNPSEFCYGSLLQKEYSNIQVTNKSCPGADNMKIFRLLLENIDNHDLIFYNTSTHTRMQCSSDIYAEQPASWVLGQHKWNPADYSEDYYKAHELFLKCLYHEDWFINIAISAVYGAYGLAKAKNKKFYWSVPYIKNSYWLRTNKKYTEWMSKFHNIEYCRYDSLNDFPFPGHEVSNEYSKYLCVDKHANNKGHKFYYDNIIKPMFLKELAQ